MLLSFFEEFPTRTSLQKLNLLNFPTKLYLAAPDFNSFLRLKDKIKKEYPKTKITEFIYWPVLKKKEGYWLSPFSKRAALKRVFQELKDKKTSVLLDLELPTAQNPRLYLTQSLNFLRNKQLIKNFIRHHSGKLYLAEYYPEGKRKEKILQLLGLHYQNKKAKTKIIKMVYHSLHHFNREFITNELKNGKKEFGNNYLVAYGTIAKGIAGWEPRLSLSQLEEDLQIAREAEIKEIVIYRLGGLNRKYQKTIKKFT